MDMDQDPVARDSVDLDLAAQEAAAPGDHLRHQEEAGAVAV